MTPGVMNKQNICMYIIYMVYISGLLRRKYASDTVEKAVMITEYLSRNRDLRTIKLL